MELRHVIGPQSPHGGHVLADPIATGGEVDPVVDHLLSIPSETHAAHCATIRQGVNACHNLGQVDRVVLSHEGHTRAQSDPIGH